MGTDTAPPSGPGPNPAADPLTDPGAYSPIPPPQHRLQLAPAPAPNTELAPDPEAAPVNPVKPRVNHPYPKDPTIPWDDIRALFVNGITVGPGLPDRTRVLELVGEADALIRPNLKSSVTRVGKFKVIFPSMNGVSDYFLISTKQVQTRAQAEGWRNLRQIYRAQLQQKHAQAKTRQRLIQVEKIDRRAHATATLGLKMVYERLEMLTSVVDMADGEMRMMADPREMDSLAKAAQTFHSLGRRALGFPAEQVGVMKAPDAAELAGYGLVFAGEIEDDDAVAVEALGPQTRFDGGLASHELAGGMVDDKPSIATELAKDDAERLHGFLTVLGRAQEASQQEDAPDGATGDSGTEDPAEARGEIGAGVGSA